MAIRGLNPIVEIMFGDFATLIVDQLLNHATKLQSMYGRPLKIPLILRIPMGGYRGYGPTHSQTLEKLFFGMPGLLVIACDPIRDQRVIWERMLQANRPCIYLENKSLYSFRPEAVASESVYGFNIRSTNSQLPTAYLKLTSWQDRTDALIFAYGGMVPLAMKVAKSLFIEDELAIVLVVPSLVSPLPTEDYADPMTLSKNILVLEESTKRSGWGAELAAFFLEECGESVNFRRHAAENTIIPTSMQGESDVLPDETSCLAAIRSLIYATH